MPEINAAGFKLIQDFEGCRLDAYDDGTGVWTIGWGHTGPDVQPGQQITQFEADQFLRQDLDAAEQEVNKWVSHNATPNQFAAMVSFEFNTGALGESTLLKLFNKGDIQGAASQFTRWVFAGGMVLAGLERRRAAEKALFLSP